MAISKPDPDEPWRYTCPDCGSCMVEKLSRVGYRVPGKKYSALKSDMEELESDKNRKYRCDNCSSKLQKVYDKKKDSLVREPNGMTF